MTSSATAPGSTDARCRVVARDEAIAGGLDRAPLEERVARGTFFWLDLVQPTHDELVLLGELLGFHPLALEDSRKFGQRPKVEEYDGFVFLVAYGRAPDEDGLVEVHCYFAERFLVTLRRDPAPAIHALHRRYEAGGGDEGAFLLYRVLDGLVDSFFPTLEQFDNRLDLIEEELLERSKDALLQDVYTMKRRLVRLRKVVGPQRDMLARLAGGGVDLPGLTPDTERHFRDVYDHLIRLTETIDGYRDMMTAAIDVYLSASSNRLNAVMKQLAAIATIFLPLTFVTGFFGQNFPWMVDHIGGPWWFLALGGVVQLAVLLGLVGYFKSKGWL